MVCSELFDADVPTGFEALSSILFIFSSILAPSVNPWDFVGNKFIFIFPKFYNYQRITISRLNLKEICTDITNKTRDDCRFCFFI